MSDVDWHLRSQVRLRLCTASDSLTSNINNLSYDPFQHKQELSSVYQFIAVLYNLALWYGIQACVGETCSGI